MDIFLHRYLGISSSFGSNAVNVEQWRCVHILRGHTGDVLDICWSPDDSMLASSSVDNNVYIWNANKFPGMVITWLKYSFKRGKSVPQKLCV